MNQSIKDRFVQLAIFSAVLFIFIMLIPQLIALGKGAIAQQTFKEMFWSYEIWAVGFFVMLFMLVLVELLVVKEDAKYGSSLGFFEAGDTPAIKTNFFKKPFKLLLLSIIIFSILGVIAGTNRQSFTGIGSLEQQFTPFDDMIFRASIIPIAENLGVAAVIAFIIFFLRYLARKYDWKSETFQIAAIGSAVTVALIYGVINHLFRYSASDLSLLTVGLFWAIGGLLTVLSGSFIPFWIMHLCNNLFLDLGNQFSSDIILIGTIFVIGVLGIAYYLLFMRKGE